MAVWYDAFGLIWVPPDKGFLGGTSCYKKKKNKKTHKNPFASSGDTGSIPGSGRSLGKGNAIHSSILAWRIPWTEEPGRL